MEGASSNESDLNEFTRSDDRDQLPVPDFSRTRSKIYQLFNWIQEKRVFKCSLCPREYPYNKKSGGASLTNHITRNHPEQLEKRNQKRTNDERTTVFEQAAETAKKRPKSHCDLDKEACRRLLLDFVISTDQPFSLVEHPKFKKYVSYLSHDQDVAKLPTDKIIAKGIETMYKQHRETLQSTLASTPGKISFIIDGWTSSTQKAFLGVIARWIDDDWKLQNRVIDLKELHGSHTGENICKAFSEVMDDFQLWNKILAITTDNARNMDTFFDFLEQEVVTKCLDVDIKNNRIRCMAHILNLACKAIIESASGKVPELHEDNDETHQHLGQTDFVGRIRKAIVAIRGSPQRREIFEKQCVKHASKAKELIRDVPTRWNSTFDMLERAHELMIPLNETLASVRELRHLTLADNDWEFSKTLMDLLMPFKDATVTLSCDHSPTLSDVSAVYQMLFDHLEKYSSLEYCTKSKLRRKSAIKPTQTWIKNSADAGWAKLQEYYPTADNDVCVVATVLDPRLKLHWYKSVGWRKEWIDDSKKAINIIWNKYKPPETNSAGNNSSITTPTRESVNSGPKQNLFKNIFAQQMSGFRKSEDELKRFLTDGAVNPEAMSIGGKEYAASLGWWKMHSNEYPNLSGMARDYLAASGSGVPVERFFSSGPDTISARRHRLSAGTIRKLLCLKNWLRNDDISNSDAIIKSAVAFKLGIIEDIDNEDHEIISVE